MAHPNFEWINKTTDDELLRKLQEEISRKYENEFEKIFRQGTANNSSWSMDDFEAQFADTFAPPPRDKPKRFSPEVARAAHSEDFYTFAAQKLGVHRDLAKALVHRRLYGALSSEIAQVLISNSTIPEVRTSCEALYDSLNPRGPR